MIDWQKDPVLMEMQGNIRFLSWAVFVLFVAGCLSICLHSGRIANDRSVEARLAALEHWPTTAALADAEWREIGRRIDALERPSNAPIAVNGATISINYDPDFFAIDAQGRLTLKSVRVFARPDQSVTVTTPSIVDIRRPGETR